MNQSPHKRSPKKSSPPGTCTTNGNVTKVMVQNGQPRPNVIYRRKGEQNSNTGVAMHGGVAKRVSGEFDFGRNNRRSSSDYGLMSRDQSNESSHTHQQNSVATPPPPSVVRVQVNYNNNVKNQRPKSLAFPGSSPDVVRGAVTPSPSKEGVATQQQQSRPMGLGRRAVTQINIKKNSNGYAMCKSQENLVKVRKPFLKILLSNLTHELNT